MFKSLDAFFDRLKRVGNIERALQETENKFDALVGPNGTVSRDVEDIKFRLGKEPSEQAKSVIRFFAISSLVGSASAWLGLYELGVKAEVLCDFLSYTLPVLAAGYAGLGLYFRNERSWYLISCALLFFGLVTFMFSKYSQSVVGGMAMVTAYGVSIVVTAALLVVFHKRVRKQKVSVGTFANGVAYWLLFFAALAEFSVLNVTLDKIFNYEAEETTLECEQQHSSISSAPLVFTCHKKE